MYPQLTVHTPYMYVYTLKLYLKHRILHTDPDTEGAGLLSEVDVVAEALMVLNVAAVQLDGE